MTRVRFWDPASASSEGGVSLSQIDFRRYLAVFRRRLWVFLATAVLLFAAVTYLSFKITPRYTATAEVMLDSRKHTVVDVEQVMSGLPAETSVVDTEVEVLRSRALAGRVVDQLHLERDPEFNPLLAKPEVMRTKSAGQIREGVIDAVERNLKIGRSGLTYVIGVTFRSKDPARAAQVANTFADLYLTAQLEAKFDANQRASVWLSSRLAGLRGEVENAEAAVQLYKAQHGLFSAEGNTVAEQDISNLDQQLASARATQAEQEARVDTAKRQLSTGSTGEDVGAALDSPVVQQLRTQRAQVSRQVADLQQRYGPRYPDLIRMNRQLADLDQQIHAEIQRVISNLDAQAQVARQRTQSLQSSLGQARGSQAVNGSASVRLNELERNAQSLRTLYQSFLDRYQQTTAQQGIEQSDANVLSRAQFPTRPSSPNLPLNLLLGLVGSLAVATALIVLLQLLEDQVATAEDVERQFDLPCLASIPLLESTLKRLGRRKQGPVDYLVSHPLSAFAEAFRGLRASVFTPPEGPAPKVVMITSALPQEGKTTTVLGLGHTIALAGPKVVIVDCDLRRRKLSQSLGTDQITAGLLEVLSGDVPLARALLRDEATGAVFLPVTSNSQTGKDVFDTPAMDSLLTELRERFDIVLLDTAPVLAVAETRVLAQKADAVVVLARWRETSRNAVRSGLHLLEQAGARIVGVVLARVDVREQARSGYGDPGYFAKAYQGYFVQ